MSKFAVLGEKVRELLKQNGQHSVYPHQLNAVFAVRKMFHEDCSKRRANGNTKSGEAFPPMAIVCPTGGGKSGIIAMLPYLVDAIRVLIITPSSVIGEQLGKAFGLKGPSFFEKTGVFKDLLDAALFMESVNIVGKASDLKNRLSNVVIVNAQKFGGRSNTTLSLLYGSNEIIQDAKGFFSQFDLLIVDEAHHFPAPTWLKIVNLFSAPAPPRDKIPDHYSYLPENISKKIVFLTATPYREENGHSLPILENLLERLAFTISREQLEEGGYIRKSKFVENSNIETLPKDIRDILKQQKKLEPRFDPQAMIIASTNKEAKEYEELLNKNAKSEKYAVAIFHPTSKVKAKGTPSKLTADFNKGIYRVAVVCVMHLEGYDNPKVTLCVILRNIGTNLLFTQFTGRCIRVFLDPGRNKNLKVDKTEAVILSYKKFNQSKMWQMRDSLAITDPTESGNSSNSNSATTSGSTRNRSRSPVSLRKNKQGKLISLRDFQKTSSSCKVELSSDDE